MLILYMVYGVDFKDKAGNVISQFTPQSEAEYMALEAKWKKGDVDDAFPETAVNATFWYQEKFRNPIQGVDYGSGSVKRRFGGMRVPKGAYEFRG